MTWQNCIALHQNFKKLTLICFMSLWTTVICGIWITSLNHRRRVESILAYFRLQPLVWFCTKCVVLSALFLIFFLSLSISLSLWFHVILFHNILLSFLVSIFLPCSHIRSSMKWVDISSLEWSKRVICLSKLFLE